MSLTHFIKDGTCLCSLLTPQQKKVWFSLCFSLFLSSQKSMKEEKALYPLGLTEDGLAQRAGQAVTLGRGYDLSDPEGVIISGGAG